MAAAAAASGSGYVPPSTPHAFSTQELDFDTVMRHSVSVYDKSTTFIHSKLPLAYSSAELRSTYHECGAILSQIRTEKNRILSFCTTEKIDLDEDIDLTDAIARKISSTYKNLLKNEKAIARMREMLYVARVINSNKDRYLAPELFTFPELHKQFVWEKVAPGKHLSKGSYGEVSEISTNTMPLVIKRTRHERDGRELSRRRQADVVTSMINEVAVLLFLDAHKQGFLRPAGVTCIRAEHGIAQLGLYMERGSTSLQSRIGASPYTIEEIQKWMYDILEQFNRIHTLSTPVEDGRERIGVVHGDVKLDNMLLINERVCLADFGKSGAHGSPRFGGTPLTNPPEYMTGGTDILTPSQDIWAIGIILFELLFEEHPFTYSEIRKGKTAEQALIDAKLAASPSSSSSDSFNGLFAIIQHCLRSKPEERPTAKQLLGHKVFEQFVGSGGRDTPTSCGFHTRPFFRRCAKEAAFVAAEPTINSLGNRGAARVAAHVDHYSDESESRGAASIDTQISEGSLARRLAGDDGLRAPHPHLARFTDSFDTSYDRAGAAGAAAARAARA